MEKSDEIEGITNYVTPHLGYKHDDKILMFTSEQYKFNLSNDNFQTLQPFSTLDSNGLSIGIEHPINRLSYLVIMEQMFLCVCCCWR